MKTPFQIKIENMQKSFIHDNVGQQDILKAEKKEKPTAEEYANGLGADKFNPKKLMREMNHHKNMAKLTGDAGHAKVYETLSKMHKDHDSHEDGDTAEKKDLSAKKGAKTKAKNAKSKAKQAMEDAKEKGNKKTPVNEKTGKSTDKTAGKTGAKDKKQAQTKPDDKKQAQKGQVKPDSTDTKDKKPMPKKEDKKVKDDGKHVEVKVVINKSEHELELLSKLGITTESIIEKAEGKYGKGKKTIQVASKSKSGKVYYKQQLVGTTDDPTKKMNKNSKVGGSTEYGSAVNTLVMDMMNKTKAGKGAIMTELANYVGYGVKADGTKVSDPKSSIMKIINGGTNPPADKKAKIAEFFGKSQKDVSEIAEGSPTVSEKINPENFMASQHKAGEFNYTAVKELLESGMEAPQIAQKLLNLGMRSAGKIMRLSGMGDYYDVVDMMEGFSLANRDDDGFDMSMIHATPIKQTRGPDGRFAGYRVGLNKIANGDHPLLVAYGKGGIGKTWNAKNVLKEKFGEGTSKREFKLGMTPNSDEYDYVIFGGKAGVQGMVKMFYEHKDKIIVFDDFDSVIAMESATKDGAGTDILKSAFDPDAEEDERMVTYKSVKLETEAGDPIPSMFPFTGSAIFITNLTRDRVPQALNDRAYVYDLSMNRQERMMKIHSLYDEMDIRDSNGKLLDIPHNIRKQAFDFMDKWQYNVGGDNLTPRALSKIAKLMKGYSQQSPTQLTNQFGKNWEKEIFADYYRQID